MSDYNEEIDGELGKFLKEATFLGLFRLSYELIKIRNRNYDHLTKVNKIMKYFGDSFESFNFDFANNRMDLLKAIREFEESRNELEKYIDIRSEHQIDYGSERIKGLETLKDFKGKVSINLKKIQRIRMKRRKLGVFFLK